MDPTPFIVDLRCCEYDLPNVRVSHQKDLWCRCHGSFGVITVHDCRAKIDSQE